MTTRRNSTHVRRTAAERAAMAQAALDRAQTGQVCANDLVIIAEYAARGIDAHPRVDVFTYSAWQALDRHVKRGEHGVRTHSYCRRD